MLLEYTVDLPITYSTDNLIEFFHQKGFPITETFSRELISEFLDDLARNRYLAWKTRHFAVWRTKHYLIKFDKNVDKSINEFSKTRYLGSAELRLTVRQDQFEFCIYHHKSLTETFTRKICVVSPQKMFGVPWKVANITGFDYHLFREHNIKFTFDEKNKAYRVIEFNLDDFKLRSAPPDGYLIPRHSLETWFATEGQIPLRELPLLINHPPLKDYAMMRLRKSKLAL